MLVDDKIGAILLLKTDQIHFINLYSRRTQTIYIEDYGYRAKLNQFHA
jgi:hypothetical protein